MKKLVSIALIMMLLSTAVLSGFFTGTNKPKTYSIESNKNNHYISLGTYQGNGESFDLNTFMQDVNSEVTEDQLTSNETLLSYRVYDPEQSPDPNYVDYVSCEVIVGLKSCYNVSQMESFLGYTIVDKIEELNTALIQVPQGEEATIIQGLEGRTDIFFAEYNTVGDMCWEPNDYYWVNGYQWGPKNICCVNAWDTERGDSSVIIAVLDSGIDLTHPDLEQNIWTNPGEIPDNNIDDDGNGYKDDIHGWNCVNNTNYVRDLHGHGTHCSGIAAAVMNNQIGITGIAGVTIMPVDVLSGTSQYFRVMEFNWAKGIKYAANNGAWIISISLGWPLSSHILCAACKWAYNIKHCLIVAAAGNSGHQWFGRWVFYPARYSSVIAVGATDQNNETYDGSWTNNYGPELEIAAPGIDIYTTFPTYIVYLNWHDGYSKNYDYGGGTSAATPIVAGVAALYYSKQLHDNPQYQMNPEVCRDKLDKTAYDIGDPGRDRHSGYGLVKANDMILKNILCIKMVGQGTVTSSPNQIFYAYNSVVQLTATPSPGWVFTGWSGDISSRSSPETVTVDGDKYVITTFADETPPEITNVSNAPSTIGFGSNVTICANVSDNGSGIDTVNVNLTFPDALTQNFTMNYQENNLFSHIFNDTWKAGEYSYTIWARDNYSNTNHITGHFNVSANATISIATLKDSCTGNQYINLTDPPNPPQNLTVIGRGLTWNNYYNATSGCNELKVTTSPINYQEDNGTWTPINNSFRQLTSNQPAYNYGYRVGNDRGLFGVYFKPNAQDNWPVAFTYNKSNDPTTYVVRSKLVGIGYLDPQSNWAYQYLQNAQSSQGQTNGDSVTYPGVFTGTDVTWGYSNTELKEAITMSNTTKAVLQSHPPSSYGLHDASSYLVFITKLDYQNLDIYNTSGLLTGNVTITDKGVDFKDVLGYFKCSLPLGEAYQLNNASVYQPLAYRIVHLNGNTYLLSGLKVSQLNAMTFPVVIDPTLSVNSATNDGYIYNRNTNYNTAWTASTGTISSTANYISIGQDKVATIPSNYDIYRGFFLFDTSSLPSNAILDNAKLQVYKKDDYSTTDFTITIQNGQPTYPHNPLQTGDYAKSHYSGNGGGLNTSRFVNGLNLIGLTNLNWINRTGMTKLCLRSFKEVNGTTPTGNEYVNVYSAEASGNYVPKLIIVYRNQSKIKNTGSTNIKGYLLIQVQFYSIQQGKWLVDKDTINETSPRTINNGNHLALDTIFNGHVRASDLTHGAGTYRVYAAFRDQNGNILKTSSGVELKAWWQFSKT